MCEAQNAFRLKSYRLSVFTFKGSKRRRLAVLMLSLLTEATTEEKNNETKNNNNKQTKQDKTNKQTKNKQTNKQKAEHLYGPASTHVQLKTTNYSRTFGFTHQRHIIINTGGQEETGKSNEKGSLSSAAIATNFEPETDAATVTRCPINLDPNINSLKERLFIRT